MDSYQIMNDMATSLIMNVTQSSWDKIKKFFKDLDAKDSIKYGNAYASYLKNTYERNSKIKTLIYRRVPKDLYSFYECIGIRYNNETIDTSNIHNILKISNKLIITGTGGIGKSILLKHLFLNAINNSEYIPVLIELRKFNSVDIKEISLYQAIYQNLYDNGFKLEDEYYSYSLYNGGYIILLDGFDEVNREKAGRVSEEIKTFSDRYNKNSFIVSSRPNDAFIGWNDFHEVTACSLTKDQALSLIKKIEFDDSVKNTFYDVISDDNLFKKYNSFASNPLLLTIMLLTFNNHASIPEKLNDFYEEAFVTLFNMHDATKDCYVRDIRSKLGCEDFKMVFSYICFKSYFKSEFEFSEATLRTYIQEARDKFQNLFFTVDGFQEDLISSVCMLVKDGLNYRFTHRLFQEYFAAWYTCKLTDQIQHKLLTNWLSESTSCFTDEYMGMLYNMQSDKVNKIIFCPGIKNVKATYDKEGFSYKLLQKMFRGIIISKIYPRDKASQKPIYTINLSIHDNYLCNIIRCAYYLNNKALTQHFKSNTITEPSIKKLAQTKKHFPSMWSFDDALSVIAPNDLLSCLEWFHKHLLFCFDLYSKYNENNAIRKRKVSSIIDEL